MPPMNSDVSPPRSKYLEIMSIESDTIVQRTKRQKMRRINIVSSRSSIHGKTQNNMNRKEGQTRYHADMMNKSKVTQSRILKITTGEELVMTMINPSKKI